MKLTSRLLSALLFIAILVTCWQIAAARQAVPIIPGPWAVLLGIAELARKGLLVKYVVASLFRVTWGYLLAVVTAIPFGLDRKSVV